MSFLVKPLYMTRCFFFYSLCHYHSPCYSIYIVCSIFRAFPRIYLFEMPHSLVFLNSLVSISFLNFFKNWWLSWISYFPCTLVFAYEMKLFTVRWGFSPQPQSCISISPGHVLCAFLVHNFSQYLNTRKRILERMSENRNWLQNKILHYSDVT